MRHTVSLKQNHEFRRLYQKGKSAVSPYFAVYCRRNGRPGSRLGITTGVKLGNAVKRNFARRRIRELYRTNESKLIPGFDLAPVLATRGLVPPEKDADGRIYNTAYVFDRAGRQIARHRKVHLFDIFPVKPQQFVIVKYRGRLVDGSNAELLF